MPNESEKSIQSSTDLEGQKATDELSDEDLESVAGGATSRQVARIDTDKCPIKLTAT